MNGADTLPRLLARNAARWPDRPAWREKRLGIWQTSSWSCFAARTRAIARGLTASGFGPGDRLAVLGDNRPDLYAALLAAQVLGGIGVPLDPDAEPAVLGAILADATPRVAIAEFAEQADRLRLLGANLKRPMQVFCANPSGLRHDEAAVASSLAALAASGAATPGGPDPLEAGTAEAPALLLYPASADPHGAMSPTQLSHARLLRAAEKIAASDPVRPTDEAFSYLPMASHEDAVYSLALGLLGGFVCNCPETPDSVLRDLREIGPTILFVPPRACTALTELVESKAAAASSLKRGALAFFQARALRAEALREQGGRVPPGLAFGCAIGELLAYGPARDQLGLSRTRWVHGADAAPPEARRLLRALGVALRPGLVGPDATDPARTGEAVHV